MATKSSKKTAQKDHATGSVKDNLDLRDEILDLKREISAFRKERDKLVIRLRKSEDESKRKDRQIEQLMDPTQNSEIRRLLSMKGAALLLNLKDQNNTLVQMLMEKNQHIKRLGNEIKTAKLYARTNKTEPYRLEISRLRSMLLQSQEALKEAAHGPHVLQPTTCLLSVESRSSSSEGTAHSSQELEELRFMVHSLETHMQYSKQLVNKKNQEIASLSRDLENVLGGHCCQRKPADNTRRCTSASLLEHFQIGKSFDAIPAMMKKPRDEEQKSRNTSKRKTAGEKWKSAFRQLLKGKRLHTNPTADDQLVWSVLKASSTGRKQSLPISLPTPASQRQRKFSLPEKNSSKLEMGRESELTTRNVSQPNHNCKTFTYRTSIDSSNDSESGSRFETIQVVAEINGIASVSDSNSSSGSRRCESPPVANDPENENCYPTGNEEATLCLQENDEDDDDVITI